MRDAPDPDRRRRRRQGLGSGGVSSMTGATSNDEIEEDEAEDGPVVPDDLDDAVRARATSSEELGEDFNPRTRLGDVRRRASNYEREYRLKLVHRLLMRQIPLDQIADQLDVSVSTVQRDRSELFRRLKTAAKKLDINILVGDSVGFYNEISAMALRIASNRKTPTSQKLQALRTAAAGRNDMHRFLSTAGVYDALKFKKEKDSGLSDIEKLMNMTQELLDEDGAQEQIPEPLENLELDDDDLELHLV